MAVAFRSEAHASGTGTSISVSVPSGAAQYDIAWVDLYLDSNTTDTDATIAGLAAAGFSMHPTVLGTQGQGARGRGFIFWKRLTGADSGSYAFGQTVSGDWEIACRLYSGVTKVGNPWIAAIGATTGSAASSANTVSIPSVTPGGSDSCIVGAAISHGTGSNPWTPPTGYTERYDGSAHLTAFDLVSPATSATGSITATSTSTTGSTYPKGYQLPLAGAGFVRVRSVTAHNWGTLSNQTITLDSHNTGDLITIAVCGKYDDAGAPGITSGWTLVGMGTGGTGSQAADTGPTFMAIFQKVATSSSETNPTISVGSPSPNSWSAIQVIATPGDGKTWRDTVQTSSPAVKFVSDTDTAFPLTGTTSSFTGQPQTDDALIAFGSTPSDGLSASPTVAFSATGLADGTQQVNWVVAKTTLASDMGAVAGDWMNFTGPATSGITVSITFTGGQPSGVIGVVALRQQSGGTTVNGGQASSTSTAQAGSVISGSVIAGGMAASTSTALAGALLVGYLIGGGTATETDTAQAGSVSTGQIVNGGQSFETDTASTGTVVGGAVVAGGQAAESDTASAGVLSQVALGGQAGETDTAAAGTVLYVVTGGQAGETDTAEHGTVGDEGLVFGGQASETDTALAGTVDAGYIGGATSNRDDGIDLDGTALVEWEPGVVATPAKYANLLAMETARALVQTGVGPAGQPLITTTDYYAPRTRERIILGGIDITYWRGVQPTISYRLIKPLLWGSGTLLLPQVSHFEILGDDATDPVLRRLKRDTTVVRQRVDAVGNIVATDYVGFLDSRDPQSNMGVSFTLGGHGSGRCARKNYVETPVFHRKHDLGWQGLDFLRRRGLKTARGTELGIPMYDRGGSDGLTWINECSGFAVTRDGTSYDLMPDEDTRVYDWRETDRETVDFTFYIDGNLVSQQLTEAFSEEVDEVFVNARTPRGEVIGFIDLPGLTQGTPPPFGGSTLEIGSTGDEVILLHEQLSMTDFLEYDDMDDPSVYDQDTADAVAEVQEEAGLATVAAAGGWLGKVNELTWNLIYNEQRIGGFSIDRSRQRPAAQKRWVSKWNRNPDGSKRDRNKDYNPHRIPNTVIKDLGTIGSQRRAKRLGRLSLTPDDLSNWQGQVTFKGAVIRGLHVPGTPVAPEDIMSREDIRPGMNGMARYFQGDTLMHVSGTENTLEQTVALMDTLARDTMELAEVIQRDRESRANWARTWGGHTRASSVRHDTMTDWIRKMGKLAHRVPLNAGAWTEVEIPAGQEGVVQKIRMQLVPFDEFAVILSQRSIGLGMLNARIPAPLTEPDSGRPWYELESITDWLDERGVLDSWGTPKQPCGYDPSLKTDENGPTAEPVTGLFVETAGLNYECAQPGRLYLYVWTWRPNYLQPGRILTQQLTSAV